MNRTGWWTLAALLSLSKERGWVIRRAVLQARCLHFRTRLPGRPRRLVC